jgi:hypothetical protein
LCKGGTNMKKIIAVLALILAIAAIFSAHADDEEEE